MRKFYALYGVFFIIISCASNPHQASVKIYLRQGEPDKAVEQALKWIEVEPENPKAYLWLGAAYVGLKDYIKASESFIKAFELDSTYRDTVKLSKTFVISGAKLFSSKGVITTLTNAGSLSSKEGKNEDAIHFFNEALKLSPGDAQIYLLLSGVYQKLDNPEKVRETLKRAVEAAPQDKDVHYYYAVTLVTDGKYDEAEEHLRKAIEIDSMFEKAYYEMGVVKFEKEDFEEAESYLKRAVEINPELEDGWFSLGVVQFKLKKYGDAVQSFQKFTELKPEDEQGWFYLGSSLYEVGQLDNALAAIDRVLALNPDSADAWNYKGLIYKKMGKTKEALEAFKRASELERK
jgi:tetratricopeptide (TPR) repeat protein